MRTLKIKCYRSDENFSNLSLFILSKGNNAGKPLRKPCPNCFVLTPDDETEKDKLYWLLYGLWQGRCFYPYLTGSVIPFLRIDDLREVLESAYIKTQENPEAFLKSVLLLQNMDSYSCTLLEQLKVLKEVKRSIILKTIK